MTALLADFLGDQTTVTLVFGALAAVAFWICALVNRKETKLDDLFMFALTVIGAVTGIYIFIGSFQLRKTAPQNAI